MHLRRYKFNFRGKFGELEVDTGDTTNLRCRGSLFIITS